ncbi:GNAT family N-acetyltransferase [Saccharopolyspora rhizosphaerae]|uniref:GNAT family N-acetyltransferase n=1 Tax=Saccharopolyspora rhizosphaerae TaxID=2492662 RepID=A0A3R8QEL7_9PSEU|nr:GNAT family N-acetyltransferase [Saccharopolyspora rhizosphaerae]RRO19215.1 GNAT family N-acetyltransferase [Saccharopolyspora rhizosphaerae]
MEIREAEAADWAEIWPFMQRIIAAGETFSYERDLDEQRARERWFPAPPARTVVAVDGGRVLGTAISGPNREGPGAHVATASFMVDPDAAGRGVGRALGRHVLDRAQADGFRAMQFNAVVETNTRAVDLWKSLGMEIVATLPEAFRHPEHGYVGLHVMYRMF